MYRYIYNRPSSVQELLSELTSLNKQAWEDNQFGNEHCRNCILISCSYVQLYFLSRYNHRTIKTESNQFILQQQKYCRKFLQQIDLLWAAEVDHEAPYLLHSPVLTSSLAIYRASAKTKMLQSWQRDLQKRMGFTMDNFTRNMLADSSYLRVRHSQVVSWGMVSVVRHLGGGWNFHQDCGSSIIPPGRIRKESSGGSLAYFT